jgi:hypothetical protein
MKTFKEYMSNKTKQTPRSYSLNNIRQIISNKDTVPGKYLDAICTDDNMAMKVAHLYMDKGYKIPEKILKCVSKRQYENSLSDGYYLILNSIKKLIFGDITPYVTKKIPIELLDYLGNFELRMIAEHLKYRFKNKPNELTDFLLKNSWAKNLIFEYI